MPGLQGIVVVRLRKVIGVDQIRRELPFGIEQGTPPLGAAGILVRILSVNLALQLAPVLGVVVQDNVDEGATHLVLRRGIGNHLRFGNPAHRCRAQQRIHLVRRQRGDLSVDDHRRSPARHGEPVSLRNYAGEFAGIVGRSLLQNSGQVIHQRPLVHLHDRPFRRHRRRCQFKIQAVRRRDGERIRLLRSQSDGSESHAKHQNYFLHLICFCHPEASGRRI